MKTHIKPQVNSEQLQNDLYFAVRDHNFVQLESIISLGANVNGWPVQKSSATLYI